MPRKGGREERAGPRQETLDSVLLICPSCQSVAAVDIDRGRKSVAFSGRPASNEGRIMVVIYARRDAVDALRRHVLFACGRTALKRTAKSCGPDAPLLASSS
jgi:hypothetical protein